MFDNIGDIKSPIKNATKAKTSQVYVTGPIHNDQTGKTHWVVVFGDSGLAWVLKGQFLAGYIEYLLSQVAMENVNVEHCKTYYKINIWQGEYGDINLWKCKMSYTGNQNQTVKRFLSFIRVIQSKEIQLGNKVYARQLNFSFFQ